MSLIAGTELVTTDDIVVIAREVWEAFLTMPLEPTASPAPAAPADQLVAGVVQVMDAWQGAVVLECSPAMARQVASAMFATSPESVTQADLNDALGELANMVGGNIKGLLPGPSRLSMPVVLTHMSTDPVAGGVLVSRVDFVAVSVGQPVHVSLWRKP